MKYSRVSIIFYAIVDNNSAEDCWPCEKAWDFFAKYSLDRVHIQSLGIYSNYDSMCDQLCKTFKDVAKSEIAKDEEGNVLYLIARSENRHPRVLSLAKLKTLEYRLFRKMREKLRNFFSLKPHDANESKSADTITKRFISEAKVLSEEHDLPRPLAYYIDLFKCAFKFIEENKTERVELLHSEYVTFSEALLAYYDKLKGTVTESTFFFSDVLDK